MKILFLSSCLYNTGGVSRVLSCIASELSKFHEVHIIDFEKDVFLDKNRYSLHPNIKVIFKTREMNKLKKLIFLLNRRYGFLNYFKCNKLWDWEYLFPRLQNEIIEYIKNNKIEVVCGVQGDLAYFVGSLKENINCLTLGWQHNSFDAYFNLPNKYYYNREYLFKRYVSKLDYNIVLTEYDENMYRNILGINSLTIYNPRSFVSNEKTLCKNKKFIACGGLREAKGFDLLIDAFSIFASHESEWILNIYGEGDDFDKLQKKILHLNLQNRVYLCGNTERVKEEMIDSSIYLLSSRWEGMPMVILEALECGLPVISFDITAVGPLISDGIEGIIVPKYDTGKFANAMLKLAQNELLRTNYSKKAVEKSNNFSVENITNKWLKILEKKSTNHQ